MARKELFFELINKELEKEGFRYVKTKNAFIKKEGGNQYIFSFEIWYDFHSVEPKLAVLVDEIEKIKKKAWGKLYQKYVTIGRGKSYLIENSDDGISSTQTQDEVRAAASKEIAFYFSFAKDYYNRATDYKYLNETLNNNPGEELYLAHNPIHTSFLAIIVAKLVSTEESRMLELFETYRKVILKFNDVYIKKYDLLVTYLSNFKVE